MRYNERTNHEYLIKMHTSTFYSFIKLIIQCLYKRKKGLEVKGVISNFTHYDSIWITMKEFGLSVIFSVKSK